MGITASNGVVASIDLMGSNEKVAWLQKTGALEIQPSKMYPSENTVVYKIIFKK